MITTYINFMSAGFGLLSALLWLESAKVALNRRVSKFDLLLLTKFFFGELRKPGLRLMVTITAKLNAWAAMCAAVSIALNATSILLS